MIYIVQAENGFIKIGSASNPVYRFSALQFASPVQLRLIAILPGSYKEERALHVRFEKSRRHNEWFAPDGPVVQFLAEVWGHGLDAVQDWVTDFELLRRTREEVARARRIGSHKRNWADPEFRARQKEYREFWRASRDRLRIASSTEAA